MEYLNGKSIRNVVNENGPYSEENALHIISEVGSAIAFLHSQTINHLDIKPDNIMLHDYGTGNGTYPVKKPDYPCAFLYLDAYNEEDVPAWAIRRRLDETDKIR